MSDEQERGLDRSVRELRQESDRLEDLVGRLEEVVSGFFLRTVLLGLANGLLLAVITGAAVYGAVRLALGGAGKNVRR